MRIAVDGRPLRHPLSGIGVYTHEILSRIAAEHDLLVYLDRWPEQPIEFAATLRSGLPRRLTGLATANVRFAQWAKRDKADVFFSPRHHLPLTLADIPAVVTIHDLVWRVAPETMRPLNRVLDTTLMPLALARADRVIAVSDDTAKRIHSLVGGVHGRLLQASRRRHDPQWRTPVSEAGSIRAPETVLPVRRHQGTAQESRRDRRGVPSRGGRGARLRLRASGAIGMGSFGIG